MRPTDVHSSLTQERLKALYIYDAETGDFRYLASGTVGRWRSGTAGHMHNSHGYISVMVDGESFLAHRLAWFYTHGKWPDARIDHINGVKTDNRIANLREATQQKNMANQHRLRKNNTTGLRGVSYRRDTRGANRWRAMISDGSKLISLGCYPTKEEAKDAYDKAFKDLHGEFANTKI